MFSPHALLLAAVLLITAMVVVLLGLHDTIPPELWAIDFGCLTAAGVAVPVRSTTTMSPAVELPPPAGS